MYTQRQLFKILLIITIIALVSNSCSKTKELLEPLLEVSKTNLKFNNQDSKYNVTVRSDEIINVFIDQSWCRVVTGIPVKSAEGYLTTELIVKVNANDETNERRASIRVSTSSLTQTIAIEQDNKYIINMPSDAVTLASKMTIGWNIGNNLEATGESFASETMWGNPKVTKELIDVVKEAGFNSIRIPCAWNGYIEDHSTYKIKESWFKRVEEVINYCLENKMITILNIHWDSGWLENNCVPTKQIENNEKQHALWTQIATRFRDYDENLLFAGTNEPNVDNLEQMTVLQSYLQTFIDAVRTTGGNNSLRNLIIQGPSTDIRKTNELMATLPNDLTENRLIMEIHYYSPWNFCGLENDESWGNMFYYWGEGYHFGDPVRDANWGEEEYVKEQFSLIKAQFIDQNIPVIMGEYGAMKRELNTQEKQHTHDTSRLYFLEYVTQRAKAVGIIPFYWDNGDKTTRLFDRSNNTIADQNTLDALMNGAKQ